MVKPTNKPSDKKSDVKKVKESKTEMFIRLAETRVKSVLKSLRILSNCSNRGNYEYSQEQVDKINLTLSNALLDTINKFTKSKKEVESFKF